MSKENSELVGVISQDIYMDIKVQFKDNHKVIYEINKNDILNNSEELDFFIRNINKTLEMLEEQIFMTQAKSKKTCITKQ